MITRRMNNTNTTAALLFPPTGPQLEMYPQDIDNSLLSFLASVLLDLQSEPEWIKAAKARTETTKRAEEWATETTEWNCFNS